ncbi:MAG: hypothetical protein ACSNEK_06125 [Parachlamydiaceae bacterium]
MNLSLLLTKIILNDVLHAKWLNTLSYLENCGARKIASCEHPYYVKEEMLKHAAEEFRHAYYLKRQIAKVAKLSCSDYTNILGGFFSKNYLHLLDIKIGKYLKRMGHSITEVKALSYSLTTFAIECRALSLYQLYEKILRQSQSQVSIKSLLLEEEAHLQEVKNSLADYPHYLRMATQIEEALFPLWINEVQCACVEEEN